MSEFRWKNGLPYQEVYMILDARTGSQININGVIAYTNEAAARQAYAVYQNERLYKRNINEPEDKAIIQKAYLLSDDWLRLDRSEDAINRILREYLTDEEW